MAEEGATELGRGKRTHEELESQIEPTPDEKIGQQAYNEETCEHFEGHKEEDKTRLQLRFYGDCLAEWVVCMDLDQNESIAAVKYKVWCLRNFCKARNMLVEEIRLTWWHKELVDASLIGDYAFGDGDFVQVTSKEVTSKEVFNDDDELWW